MECRVLTSQPTPARVLRGKVFVQKHLNHVSAVAIPALGINPTFDYALYCRTRACLLCMFVLLLQPLRRCCVKCVIRHEPEVREEQPHTYM